MPNGLEYISSAHSPAQQHPNVPKTWALYMTCTLQYFHSHSTYSTYLMVLSFFQQKPTVIIQNCGKCLYR